MITMTWWYRLWQQSYCKITQQRTPAFFPQRLSENALSTFFGTSADTDVQGSFQQTLLKLQYRSKHLTIATSSAILARNIFNEILAYVWKTDFTLIMVQVIRSNKPFWVLLHQRSYDWLFRSLVYKFPFKFDWYIFL